MQTNLYHPCTFPFILAFLYAAAGSTFTVGSSDDQTTSKDHLHPSLSSLTQNAYLFIQPLNNFLTPPIASQLELQPLYHH